MQDFTASAFLLSFFCKRGPFFSDFSGGNLRPRWGRSAGPDFSPMRNRGKNRQRRGLPPPCGIHPAVLDGGCVLLCSALGLVGSHRWRKNSTNLQKVPVPLCGCTSIPRALPWCTAVPSYRGPDFRRRERRFSRVGPDAEIAWL